MSALRNHPNRTTTQRGYGSDHARLRARLAPVVATGTVRCPRCTRLIGAGQAWDLGHSDDRTRYTGPEHRACNRAHGAAKARAVGLTKPLGQRTQPVWHGRELIALMGAPGAGKSTWAHASGRQVVTTDALRDGGSVDAVYARAYDRLGAVLHSNAGVVFDTPLVQATTRQRLLRLARAYRARARLVVLQTPVDVCIARQAGRANPVPEERVRAIDAALVAQWPSLAAEGWDAVDWVSNADFFGATRRPLTASGPSIHTGSSSEPKPAISGDYTA